MSIRDKYYPWANSLSKEASVNLATLFGLGKLPAPGTWGSAAGVLLYPVIFKHCSLLEYAILAAALLYGAVGVCDAAERHLNRRDPGMINLDEFAAMPLCFISLFGDSYGIVGLLSGFAIFRFFDIKKPFLIDKAQSLDGGLGCVADDAAAALATAACLNICSLIWHLLS